MLNCLFLSSVKAKIVFVLHLVHSQEVGFDTFFFEKFNYPFICSIFINETDFFNVLLKMSMRPNQKFQSVILIFLCSAVSLKNI